MLNLAYTLSSKKSSKNSEDDKKPFKERILLKILYCLKLNVKLTDETSNKRKRLGHKYLSL